MAVFGISGATVNKYAKQLLTTALLAVAAAGYNLQLGVWRQQVTIEDLDQTLKAAYFEIAGLKKSNEDLRVAMGVVDRLQTEFIIPSIRSAAVPKLLGVPDAHAAVTPAQPPPQVIVVPAPPTKPAAVDVPKTTADIERIIKQSKATMNAQQRTP